MSADCGVSILSTDDPRWLELTSLCPESNIFHHPAWLNLLQQSYRCKAWIAAVLDSSGQLLSGLPVVELNRPFKGLCWVSLPFTDHCQPLSRVAGDSSQLLDSLLQLSQSRHVSQLELRCEVPSLSPQTEPERVLHQIPLEDGFQAASTRIHAMHRRNTRKAAQNNVRIEMGTTIDHVRQFYYLHRLTRRRQGVPVQPWRFFELIAEQLLDRGKGFVLLARQEENLLAGAVFLHHNRVLTYKYGATDPKWTVLKPNNLIFSEAIRIGCEEGFRVLDMGRTDAGNTGLREFKSRWGAEETVLRYSYFPPASESHRTSRLMPVLGAVIRSSPPWVCQLLGEMLYRYAA